jgi:hypothetical protein
MFGQKFPYTHPLAGGFLLLKGVLARRGQKKPAARPQK